MVLAGQFRRACAIGLFGAAIAGIGVFAASRAPVHSGDGAHAILNEMSDFSIRSEGDGRDSQYSQTAPSSLCAKMVRRDLA